MQASEVYAVEVLTPTRPRWRRLLARVFATLGDYAADGAVHILILEAATGRVLADVGTDSAGGTGTAGAEIRADLDTLTAGEFARRWIP